jgi:hypothetical protein
MSEFRCIGYFGPYCPTDALFYESQNMRLVPLKNYEHTDQFPIELATKIFWEADTINMTASVTTNNKVFSVDGSIVDRIVTGTCNRTVKWGVFHLSTQPIYQNFRQEIKTAAEMLCHISDTCDLEYTTPFPSHTTFSETIDQGFEPWANPSSQVCVVNPDQCKWQTVETIFISPRPYYNPEQKNRPITLYAPFGFNLENSGIVAAANGIYINSYNPDRPIGTGNATKFVGQADIITPWGSCKVDMAGGLAVTNATMTITVTAADAATRYGIPDL